MLQPAMPLASRNHLHFRNGRPFALKGIRGPKNYTVTKTSMQTHWVSCKETQKVIAELMFHSMILAIIVHLHDSLHQLQLKNSFNRDSQLNTYKRTGKQWSPDLTLGGQLQGRTHLRALLVFVAYATSKAMSKSMKIEGVAELTGLIRLLILSHLKSSVLGQYEYFQYFDL